MVEIAHILLSFMDGLFHRVVLLVFWFLCQETIASENIYAEQLEACFR